MGYDFQLQGETHRVHPLYELDRIRLSIGGRTVEADLAPTTEDGAYSLEIDGREERVFAVTRGDVHFIHLRGRVHRVESINALERARHAAQPSGGDEVLRAPMPGTVVAVAVAEGDRVESGALLVTIESMKLETALTAPHSARVAEVCVAPGANFNQGDALVRLAAEADEEEETSR